MDVLRPHKCHIKADEVTLRIKILDIADIK